jgi:hypothetical protein
MVTAQSSGSEQRLVGTWRCEGMPGMAWYDSAPTWVFNSDGSMSGSIYMSVDASSKKRPMSFYTYAAAGNKLILTHEAGAGGTYICDFYISADGKTLVVIIEGDTKNGDYDKIGLMFRR